MKIAFNAARETVVLTAALLAMAGCDRRPADIPQPTTSAPTPAPDTSVPAPMSPASAASQ